MPPPASRYSSDYARPATTSARRRRSSSVLRSTASTAASPAPGKGSITRKPTRAPALPGARNPSPPISARPCRLCPAPAWRLSASRTTRTSGTCGPTSSNSGTTARRNDRARSRPPRFQGDRCAARSGSSAMIKDVVVNLSRGQDFAADYAISLGAAFGAHLVGISFVYDPVIPDGTMGGLPVDLIEAQRNENSREARSAAERFEASARAAGIAVETRLIDASVGGAATRFGEIARRFDLAVVGQAQRDHIASEDLTIEAALFESGRPVVVVPYIQKQGLKLDRVIVGWDGSRTAARAIGDAMPFLERARAVEVMVVAEERKRDRASFPPRHCRHAAPNHQGRYQHRERHPVLRGRQRRRLSGDGRLRAFTPARIHSGRRDAWNSFLHDAAGADVALRARLAAGRVDGLALELAVS